jgi:hypothetical protein
MGAHRNLRLHNTLPLHCLLGARPIPAPFPYSIAQHDAIFGQPVNARAKGLEFDHPAQRAQLILHQGPDLMQLSNRRPRAGRFHIEIEVSAANRINQLWPKRINLSESVPDLHVGAGRLRSVPIFLPVAHCRIDRGCILPLGLVIGRPVGCRAVEIAQDYALGLFRRPFAALD